jgi:hypothetical protein
MCESAFYAKVSEAALKLLGQQTVIPSHLLEERMGEVCMCTGAAVLFAAHIVRGGRHSVTDFFADLGTETEDDFVETRARMNGLDPNLVRSVIVVSKALTECDRPRAVPD